VANTAFTIDTASSTLTVRTRARGLLARLAHDLEIAARDIAGAASVDGASWSGELEVPVAGLRVVGVPRGEAVDTSALSSSDRAEIERRMRDDVLAGTQRVKVRASGASRDRGEAIVELARGSARVSPSNSVRDEGEKLVVSGRVQVSLKALGIKEIKGPLGAFSVNDIVEIRYALTLVPVP
jgi:hypothetical protein